MTEILWMAPILALIYAIPVALAAWRARQRHARQDALRAEAGAALQGLTPVRVHLARADWFRSTHLAESEGSGWLAYDAQQVRLRGRLDDGSRIEQDLVRAGLALRWVGDADSAGSGLHWFALGESGLRVSADGLSRWNSAAATADLYSQLAAPGTPPPPRSVFHLQSHPLSLGVTVVFALLMLYAAWDGYLNPFALVGEHVWVTLLALAAIPLSLLLYPLFLRTRLPQREALLLPLLLGLATTLATIPLVKRIDSATGSAELAEVAFYVDGAGVLKPMQSGPPVVQVRNIDDYWAQMPPGTEQRFLLRRGGLGLWQMEVEGLRRQVHGWYQSQSRTTPRLSVH